jgi:hypothetical protein
LRGRTPAFQIPKRNIAVTDIFHEVEEDVRRERFEKLWKQYGDYAIAAVAAVVIAVAGYKFWQRYEFQQRTVASGRFYAAQELANRGDAVKAAQAYGDIVKTAPSGYASVAQLAQADALYSADNTADALAVYKAIAQKKDSPLADVARLRAAWIEVETQPKSSVETLLAPLTNSTSAYRFMAREILAYADYRAGALAQAQKEFETLASDPNVPAAMHGRTNAMAIFIKAGGDKNLGTVPPPQTPQPQGTAQGQTNP